MRCRIILSRRVLGLVYGFNYRTPAGEAARKPVDVTLRLKAHQFPHTNLQVSTFS